MYGYDSLDPNANMTITWDLMVDNDNEAKYDVRISLYNFQLFRHVENLEMPGWKLSWIWQGDEAIWDMWEAKPPNREIA
uniref:Uncharacterized protein n=1 Tax=Quercus lobata TaxID=97700 RepID=A0A7N2MEF5_QUELO